MCSKKCCHRQIKKNFNGFLEAKIIPETKENTCCGAALSVKQRAAAFHATYF